MNTSPLIERVFGANWRTSLSGFGASITLFLTIIAAAPYNLGPIAEVMSPDQKQWVFICGAIATTLLKLINSANQKDKQVAGNGTVQEPNKVATDTGGNRTIDPT